MPQDTVRERHERMRLEREPYLRRARAAALFTIPALMPEEGHNATTDLPTPYQSLGARGVRNLASKLLLVLFPPGTPFFQYSFTDLQLQQLFPDGQRGELDEVLSTLERAIVRDLEASNFRKTLFAALMQLLIAGNVLIRLNPDGGARLYKLDTFVQRRRPRDGKLVEFIIREEVLPEFLPESVQAQLPANPRGERAGDPRPVEVFSHFEWQNTARGGWWTVKQTADKGIPIPGSEGRWPEHAFPYIAVRMSAIDGEHYGRGYVEELHGDLMSFDGLSQHILDGAAAAAKLLWLCDPNGQVKPKDMEKPNLSAIPGRVGDVAALRADKTGDFQVAVALAQDIQTRLEQAFLLHASIQRNAERVTAQEIRFMASELEDALGGIYTVLTQELQLPVITATVDRMGKQRKLPPDAVSILQNDVEPMITTGLQALGRGRDLEKYRGWLSDLQATFGPEGTAQVLNQPEVAKRTGAGWGIDTNGLIKTPEQILQETQQAQLQQLVDTLGPEALKQLGESARASADNT